MSGFGPAQGTFGGSATFTNLTVTGTATFASTVTVTGVLKVSAGTEGAPSIAPSSWPTFGFFFSSNSAWYSSSGTATVRFTDGISMRSAAVLSWTSSTAGAASDLTLARLAAASLRIGLAPSATPVAQTLTIGEASRPGTDTNVGGASGTIASGLGTGAGAASSLIFQTPTVGSTGSTVQSLATRLTVATAGITATVPVLLPDGSAGTPSLSFTNDSDSGFLSYGGGNAAYSANGGATVGLMTTGITLPASLSLRWSSSGSVLSSDLILSRHSAANLRQGAAAANDADGAAQTLRSPSGGTVSSGTTGRNGGAYTIQAGDGSAAKASSGANGGVGGTLTLYGGAGGAGDGAGVTGAYGGVVVARAAGKLGFYDTAPVALQTGVAVSAAGIHAALVNLGLITA